MTSPTLDAAERAEFEKWAKAHLFHLRRSVIDPEQYHALEAECAWQAWQARAALSAPQLAGNAVERDAARYRWLRASGVHWIEIDVETEVQMGRPDNYDFPSTLDAAIDSAIQQQEGA